MLHLNIGAGVTDNRNYQTLDFPTFEDFCETHLSRSHIPPNLLPDEVPGSKAYKLKARWFATITFDGVGRSLGNAGSIQLAAFDYDAEEQGKQKIPFSEQISPRAMHEHLMALTPPVNHYIVTSVSNDPGVAHKYRVVIELARPVDLPAEPDKARDVYARVMCEVMAKCAFPAEFLRGTDKVFRKPTQIYFLPTIGIHPPERHSHYLGVPVSLPPPAELPELPEWAKDKDSTTHASLSTKDIHLLSSAQVNFASFKCAEDLQNLLRRAGMKVESRIVDRTSDRYGVTKVFGCVCPNYMKHSKPDPHDTSDAEVIWHPHRLPIIHCHHGGCVGESVHALLATMSAQPGLSDILSPYMPTLEGVTAGNLDILSGLPDLLYPINGMASEHAALYIGKLTRKGLGSKADLYNLMSALGISPVGKREDENQPSDVVLKYLGPDNIMSVSTSDGRTQLFWFNGKWWEVLFHAQLAEILQRKYPKKILDEDFPRMVAAMDCKIRARNVSARAPGTGNPTDQLVVVSNNYDVRIVDGRPVSFQHSRETNALSGIDVDYSPTSTCPTFRSLIDSAFPLPADQTLLQEIFAASVLGYRPESLRGMLFVKGSEQGCDGKTSLFGRVLSRLLGSRAFVQDTSFERTLSTPEGRMPLMHRKVLLVDDRDRTVPLSGHLIKQVAEFREVLGRNLYSNAVTFEMNLMAIYLSNNYPVLTGFDSAVMSRVLVLDMDRSHRDAMESHAENPWDRVIAEELSGVLNWALEGLPRLMEHKGFSTNYPEHRKRQERMLLAGSTHYRFLAAKAVAAPGMEMDWAEVVRIYSMQHGAKEGVKEAILLQMALGLLPYRAEVDAARGVVRGIEIDGIKSVRGDI